MSVVLADEVARIAQGQRPAPYQRGATPHVAQDTSGEGLKARPIIPHHDAIIEQRGYESGRWPFGLRLRALSCAVGTGWYGAGRWPL
jgi:hypothetical protein